MSLMINKGGSKNIPDIKLNYNSFHESRGN